jgi:hypothetical protein
MSSQTEFPLIFEKLKSILKSYSQKFIVKADTSDGFSLDGAYSEKWKRNFSLAQHK